MPNADLAKGVQTLIENIPAEHRRRGAAASAGAGLGAVVGSLAGGPVGAAIGAGIGGTLGILFDEKRR
jgi:hypothetical protein